MEFKVNIERTQNKFINKFEVSNFITNHISNEYNNIDEAKDSKLAQELFYLPFVKKVYITPSFISIERFNIVEWGDVEDEVKNLIENYLNSGQEVISNIKRHFKYVFINSYQYKKANSIKRIISCNPFGGSGYDPVHKKKNEKK